ncbi:hypothetical protein [Halalkalicoccus jeotgali]|uniref:Uncharacterized protein n=1 Tax=Halalkalicoccus jeotgali (strain DSM 18796 / CECT 7217 / JCM 14584 / KCTC 4019 / B3) TaxID=795797 RepID=L9VCY2_HALJB|nr:hypothetical protein [Halalkalicoccus jeotgali]ELY34919.1 hypothetical protein C497_14307 [Halalkalicoccus jeotgali B3]
MTLTRSTIEEKVAEYEREEPFYPVEQEGIETYPAAFAAGEFGFRDAEWVVQWYYRRYLGAGNREARAGEAHFGENGRGAVREAVIAAANAAGIEDAIGHLSGLEGVDVAVASAFLQFIDPERYVAVDGRTWGALSEAGELDDPYPESLSIEEYRRFLDTCRAVAEDASIDCWTLYRALWRLGREN